METLLAIAAVVLTAFGLFVWLYELRTREAVEATITPTEQEQFRGFRMVPPWRKASRNSK